MNKQEWDINTCRYWDVEIGCVRDVCRCEQEEPKKTLEKYSERFDNDKSLIGNPETWGKRIIEEPKQETIEYDLLQHIKFCLECKNESQAIRLIEKYGFVKQEEKYEALETAISLLKQTTEFEVLDSWKQKVRELEQFKKK